MQRSQKVSRLSRTGKRTIQKLSRWQKTATALSAAVAGVVGLLGQAHPTHAQYTWDPNGTLGASGNSGPWNLTTANWFSGGSSDVIWPFPSNTSTAAVAAVFGGSPGSYTVTMGNNVTTSGITFNSGPTYTINGANNNASTNGAIFLAGAVGVTSGNTNVAFVTNQSATINAIVAGSTMTGYNGEASYGLTQSGAGTLTFGAGDLQYYQGGITLNGGGITMQSSGSTPTDLGAANQYVYLVLAPPSPLPFPAPWS